ncbi:sporulation membrane protein YtaF [Halobacillus mangrovi]|uniref:Sporulation membrane protein YtaF n=1 Tax=Halobacillus mangrovi TaxID=402384 RepID=A0A1W5ZU84_9BACI|nr:sporulation membrane protein YtaF [Halobacillus mangrovi]ARI76831.1 sporulation membrane protein YtaF [Halobacillus mangrovi]
MGIVTFTILFVTAVSIDSFGIGCVLGMKRIGLALPGVLFIAFFSGIGFLLSSYIGHLVLPFVSAEYADRLGAIALICIGIYFLWQYFRKHDTAKDNGEPWLKPSRVLNDPQTADVDRSGGIRGKEVWLLGTALSLDTIGAGVSGAFIGVSPFITSLLIFLATFLMLFAGIKGGAKFSEKAESISILPGVLLIIIGMIKLA